MSTWSKVFSSFCSEQHWPILGFHYFTKSDSFLNCITESCKGKTRGFYTWKEVRKCQVNCFLGQWTMHIHRSTVCATEILKCCLLEGILSRFTLKQHFTVGIYKYSSALMSSFPPSTLTLMLSPRMEKYVDPSFLISLFLALSSWRCLHSFMR